MALDVYCRISDSLSTHNVKDLWQAQGLEIQEAAV